MAYATQRFLGDYGVKHRVSSVAYPHSNRRAELAVKSMKRLIRENTSPDGSLNNDKFLRAVRTYRNTPDRDTERSPAQVIFGRNLRDFLLPLCRDTDRSHNGSFRGMIGRELSGKEHFGTWNILLWVQNNFHHCKSRILSRFRTRWGTTHPDGTLLE